MKILLDIDDTAIISEDKGKTYYEHPLLKDLLSKYDVVLFSGNPDIFNYYKKWKAKGYIAKGSDTFPKADVLIDNDYELWQDQVDVKKCFYSIDDFMKWEGNKYK